MPVLSIRLAWGSVRRADSHDGLICCAAELLQDGKMSRAADVYSFSMIMWELFACKRLYEGHIASQVGRQHLPFVFPSSWQSAKGRLVIICMWTTHPILGGMHAQSCP